MKYLASFALLLNMISSYSMHTPITEELTKLNNLYESHRGARIGNPEEYRFTWQEINLLADDELDLRFLMEAKRLSKKIGEPVFRKFVRQWEKDSFAGLPHAIRSINNGQKKVEYVGDVNAVFSPKKVTTFLLPKTLHDPKTRVTMTTPEFLACVYWMKLRIKQKSLAQ
jgi:hypothetical protein